MFITSFLGRLRLSQKFIILSVVALGLACIPAWLYIVEADKNLQEAVLERQGIRPLADLHKLIQLAQQHRGIAAMSLSGLAMERQTRQEKQKEVDAAIAVVALDMHNISDKSVQKLWSDVRADWDALRGEVISGSITPLKSNQAHADMIARLLEANDLVGDYYGLSLDPDMDTYQLIQYMDYQLPYLTEESGQMRARGAALLAQRDISIEDRVLMSAVTGRVHDRFELMLKAYDKSVSANPHFGNLLDNGVRSMSKLVSGAIDLANEKIVKRGAVSFPPDDYVAYFTQAIDAQFESGAEAGAALQEALTAKIAAMEKTRRLMLGAMALLIALAALIQYAIARSVLRPTQRAMALAGALTVGVAEKLEAVEAIASGNLDHDVTLMAVPDIDPGTITHDEMGVLLTSILRMSEVQRSLDSAFRTMTASLRNGRETEHARDWLKSGLNELNGVMRGEHETNEMAEKVLNYLAERLDAGVGALYLYDADALYLYGADERRLHLAAGYALTRGSKETEQIALGQGLAGQAARDKKTLVLSDVPDGYLTIGSGMGNARPRNIIAIPLVYADSLAGVIELGSFRPFSALEMDFLEHVREGVAIGFGVNQSRHRLQTLLAQTEQQTEELRVQQEELQQSNEELEERAEMLEAQREQIRAKNDEVEMASREIQRKVEELERVSSYKSEFLANMSHELRTPLNSMLILSSLLQKNKDGLLSPKQVEYAATINGAGKDLLNLINDILDLSKIEAGRLEFHVEEIAVEHMVAELTGLFKPLADNQHLHFSVKVADGTPPALRADAQRLQQIIKNLLSNAFKFTAQGQVTLAIGSPAAGTSPLTVPALTFAVSDSGIGIPADKQEQIFHAFKQADGSTSRKYGGTGLGLSISRQLAQRMGGEILLHSEPGHGSVFTLYLPLDADQATPRVPSPAIAPVAQQATPPATPMQPWAKGKGVDRPVERAAERDIPASDVDDDRATLQAGERAILIVEDDQGFAGILRDTVRDHGFKAVVATDGETGLALVERYAPEAIILDVMLPHIDGWGVMRSIKDNPRTRHIPVHFITCLEDRQKALNMGAIGFVSKPVDSEQLDDIFKAINAAIDKSARKLLVVEDDEVEANSIAELLDMGGLEIVIARTGHEALERLQQEKFDCMVLDLGLADMSGYDLLDQLQRMSGGRQIPVIVHSGRDLSEADERRLKAYTDNIIVKGAQSPERLLNEVSLFLHLVESSLPQEKQKMIRHALDTEALLDQRKVLVVDDDIRNIFSLSSVLGDKGMHIVEAGNGREALAELDAHSDIDIVLMDIMMPEMDGYEAMRRIRKNPRFTHLPIIALTAKAMVGDQKLCLDAGANDYITKPVDIDKLFSLMRVWLYQAGQHRTQ